MQTSQTANVPSRFNAGPLASPNFEILYLCENPTLALEEVQAQFHLPNGQIISNPAHSWLIINVQVQLQAAVDLTDPATQQLLETNAQELTGDWRGYHARKSHSSVPWPTGIAPTQQLGQALCALPGLEGFQAISSKRSDHRMLAVFPKKLGTASWLRFVNPISNSVHTIPLRLA